MRIIQRRKAEFNITSLEMNKFATQQKGHAISASLYTSLKKKNIARKKKYPCNSNIQSSIQDPEQYPVFNTNIHLL